MVLAPVEGAVLVLDKKPAKQLASRAFFAL
jgi:hypothetical protein